MSVRSGTAYVFAAALVLSPSMAFAASPDAASPVSKAPLAPAGAAGVKKAEGFTDNTAVLIAGGALVVVGIALVAGGGNGHSHPTTTSTGARP